MIKTRIGAVIACSKYACHELRAILSTVLVLRAIKANDENTRMFPLLNTLIFIADTRFKKPTVETLGIY